MKNWAEFGFSRIAAIFPELKRGLPLHNAQCIQNSFSEKAALGASVVFTSELALNGALSEIDQALLHLRNHTRSFSSVLVVGAPVSRPNGSRLSGAWVLQAGRVVGVVVGDHLVDEKVLHPSLGEFPLCAYQVFSAGNLRFGIEMGTDFGALNAASKYLALKGAHLILGLDTSSEKVGSAADRMRTVQALSQKLHCAYFYSSFGNHALADDTVLSTHAFVYENGHWIAELTAFHHEPALMADVDSESLERTSHLDPRFLEAAEKAPHNRGMIQVLSPVQAHFTELNRKVEKTPFISEILDYEEVIQIQCSALLRKVQSSETQKVLIGVSGDLSSTLALYVALRTKALSGNQITLLGKLVGTADTDERQLNHARILLQESGIDEVLEEPAVPIEALSEIARQHQAIWVGEDTLTDLILSGNELKTDSSYYGVNLGIPRTVAKGLVAYWGEIAVTRILKSTVSGIADQESDFDELYDFILYYAFNFGFLPEKIAALAEIAFVRSPASLNELPTVLEHTLQRLSRAMAGSRFPQGPKDVFVKSLAPVKTDALK